MTIKREPRIYEIPKKYIKAMVAGRVDLLAECSGRWSEVYLDGVYVLDWKSSKTPYSNRGYPEWPMQVSTYYKGTIQTGVGLPDGAAIVRLDKETGVPDIYDYSEEIEESCNSFFHLLEVYRYLYPQDFGNGVPSVTTVLAILAKPALIQWAANCSRDWVLQQLEEHLKSGEPIDRHYVKQWAEEAPKNFRKVSRVGTGIGKEVHSLIELDLKGKPLPKRCHILPHVENGFDAYLAFKAAVNLKPIAIEYKVYARA